MKIQNIADHEAQFVSGGGVAEEGTNYGQAKKCDPCLDNPSSYFPCDTNYGQAKKEGYCGPNPSEAYPACCPG